MLNVKYRLGAKIRHFFIQAKREGAKYRLNPSFSTGDHWMAEYKDKEGAYPGLSAVLFSGVLPLHKVIAPGNTN